MLVNCCRVPRISTFVRSRFPSTATELLHPHHHARFLHLLPGKPAMISAWLQPAISAAMVQRRGAFSSKKSDLDDVTGAYPGLAYELRNKRRGRPLAPFLFAYKMHFSMALSLMNRITGAAYTFLLYMGAIGAVSSGKTIPQLVEAISDLGVNPHILMTAKVVLGWGLFFHMINGIRHLTWDSGKGLRPPKMINLTGYVVVILTTLVTILVCTYY